MSLIESDLEVVRDLDRTTELLEMTRDGSNNQPFLSELGGGVLKFADTVFPTGQNDTRVYGIVEERDAGGRGAHFDIYGAYLDKTKPWIAIYNLAGTCALTTALLPDELGKHYFSTYTELDDNAMEARRHYSAIALNAPGAVVGKGLVTPRRGLVLPQRASGPHVIHDLVPRDDENPGKFVKLIPLSPKGKHNQMLIDRGYVALDELLTKSLGAAPESASAADTVPAPESIPNAIRIRRRVTQPTLPRRRNCNLD